MTDVFIIAVKKQLAPQPITLGMTSCDTRKHAKFASFSLTPMAVSKLLFVLVIIFGSSSWMGTNSIWMQLPLLTANLPEGWGLPSFLAAVVQVACIGPLVYTILHKGCESVTVPTVPLITAFLTLASFCQLGLVFAWWWTVPIAGREYSVALYLLLFGLALVNATSNVLFMPFMAQFHRAYLNAYFVGMGFSSLVPSLLTLLQEQLLATEPAQSNKAHPTKRTHPNLRNSCIKKSTNDTWFK
ncbi:hypothetical protein TELCIR_16073 [Teladorsagia circumcincta]|uniref:Riboflavin transporter n=1 Tax=Teladorsagia circumcincta TaxID=45464 RepID=A0A2G9TWH4_TELCI|nr:hypothetical protein TELCIR_16073 [Teladorsagia circumcincta]